MNLRVASRNKFYFTVKVCIGSIVARAVESNQPLGSSSGNEACVGRASFPSGQKIPCRQPEKRQDILNNNTCTISKTMLFPYTINIHLGFLCFRFTLWSSTTPVDKRLLSTIRCIFMMICHDDDIMIIILCCLL